MALAILSVIAFLALIVWRFVFNGQQRRPVVREIGAPRQQDNSFLEQGLHILDLVGVAVIPDNRFENSSNGAHPITPKARAQSYLRRVVALTGATLMGSGYVLDVGTTRFEVRDRYVRRLRDLTDPKCAYEETCFYSADKSTPRTKACRKPSKLPPRCCSSGTIQRCLTGGPLRAGRLSPTARPSGPAQ